MSKKSTSKTPKSQGNAWPLSDFPVPTAAGQVSSAAYHGLAGPDATKATPPKAVTPDLQTRQRQDGASLADLQPGLIQSPKAGRPGGTDAREAADPKRRAGR